MTGNPDCSAHTIYENVIVHVGDRSITIYDHVYPRVILAEYEIRPTEWRYNLDEGDSMPTNYQLVKA